MKKLFLFLLFVFAASINLPAQIVTGQVANAETKEPIEYTSIGVLNRNLGTVSGLGGKFKLDLKGAADSDTVKVSMVGFQSRLFPVKAFRQHFSVPDNSVFLQPQTRQLNEVVIKPQKMGTMVTGNTTDSKIMAEGFVSNDLGSEIGTVLKFRKKKPGRLESVHFNIANNNFDAVKFRVNIYTFKNGQVGENLLQEPIYLKTEVQSGTISLDLTDRNIIILHDCLLSLEWIEDLGKNNLMFSCGLINAPTYYRKTSQGSWSKAPAGAGFWANVTYEK